jgi:alkylation response protein AidB-like acyl-CoA dehydrogenase
MTVDPVNEIIAECRKFIKNEIQPHALDADLTKDTDWVRTVWEKSAQLDLPLLLIPEVFDGAGLSPYGCAALLDVLGSACAGIASVYASHFTACLSLLKADETRQQSFFNWLAGDDHQPPRMITAVFPSETDDFALRLENQNGQMVLDGTSPLTGNAACADGFCIFVPDRRTGAERVTCVILKKDSVGVTMGQPANLPGLKVCAFTPLVFDNVVVEPDAVIGSPGEAHAILAETKNSYFRFVAAIATGAARQALDQATAYARERYQFGNTIGHHQEIQRMIGSMQMKLDMGTAGYTNSINAHQIPPPFPIPDASLVKTFCTKAALEIAFDAIQIHGGYGYLHEYGLEKIMRDIKVLQLLGGRNPRHQIEAGARKCGYAG